MEGLDIEGKAINESGIVNALNDYCANTMDNENQSIDATLVMGKTIPQLEEVGNGGGKPPTLLPHQKSIKSFKELIDVFNKENPGLVADCNSFVSFMKQFYENSSSYL